MPGGLYRGRMTSSPQIGEEPKKKNPAEAGFFLLRSRVYRAPKSYLISA